MLGWNCVPIPFTMTYLVVKKHDQQKDQCVFTGIFKDSHGTRNNSRIQIKQINVIHSISTPNKDTAPPEPLQA